MKIIDPIINSKINLTKNNYFFSSSFRNRTALLPIEEVYKPIEFTIEKARCIHTFWIKEICEVTLSLVISHGRDISEHSPELLETKMKKGEAVIAFASDGRWAGFSFISSCENGSYISNSALVIAPEFRHTGLVKKIKRKIFELSREMYPDACIFSLTSDLTVMKMNHKLGFKRVNFSELPSNSLFWESCKSCINCPVLMSQERKNCLCTAMLYNPKQNSPIIK